MPGVEGGEAAPGAGGGGVINHKWFILCSTAYYAIIFTDIMDIFYST